MILGRRRPGAVAAGTAVRPARAVVRGRDRSRERWFYLLIAPWLFGLVVLQVLPMLGATTLSFAEWEPPLAPRWVGLDNFAELGVDPRFASAVANTIVYGLATVLPGLAIGLSLALVLGPRRRGGTVLRTTVFLPAIVAGVATALMWGWVFNPRYGLVDGVLGIVGLQGPAWLRDPGWAMPAMVVIGLWNVGVNVVVYIAALGTVPRDLHDAAALDGAGSVARFRYVTWPALLPITFYLAIVNAIAASQVFTPSYVLTRGGPDDATLTTALYTYQTAFAYGRLGYGSAMAIVVFIAVLVLTAIGFRVVGRRVPYLGAESWLGTRRFGVSWRAVLAVLVVFPFIVPFVWLIASAFKPIDQFYAAPPTLLPDPPSLANLQAVLDLLDVPRLFANSAFIALTVAGTTVLASSIVGFAFATLPARGSRLLFGVLIATILIPPTVAIVPQFILFSRIGWVGSFLPLIVPSLFGNAFAIFLFRQWFRNLPPHLFESAELEGATPIQAFRHIALPLARPVVAAVAVFAFVGSWNDFLGPLVYLRSPDTYTVSLGMATFQGVHVNDVHLSVAMACIALIPPILVFVIAQRALVHGISTGGFRG